MTLQIDRGFYQKKYKNNERDFDAIAVDVLVDDLGDDLDGVAAVLLVLLEVDENCDASDILRLRLRNFLQKFLFLRRDNCPNYLYRCLWGRFLEG